MRYVGSKARHARQIIDAVETVIGSLASRHWVEPFVGGGNMIACVDAKTRTGIDKNEDVIILLKALAAGWAPPTSLSEKDYSMLREAAPSALRSFAGFCCSFGGKWFGGYARAPGTSRDLTAEGARNLLRQSVNLHTNVHFYVSDFRSMRVPHPRSVIYCDPPYEGTQGYRTGAFDHKGFWAWCDYLVREGHDVFVSEYKAPDHWSCIWNKSVKNTLDKDTGGKTGVERLFHRRLTLAEAVDGLTAALHEGNL